MRSKSFFLNSSVLLGFALLSVGALSGCVSTTIQEVRDADTGIENYETIAILGRKHKTRNETESSFIDCVTDKTSSGSNSLRVVSDQEFVDALFPWFEARTAPIDIADMERLFKVPKIANKLEEIGVRYIVWIEGTTQRQDQSGTVQCAIATGGIPACFGFLTWEAGSDYEATVWDIRNRITVGKLSSEATGMSFVPAIIVPLPFVARTQAHACSTMSNQIKVFIQG